MAPERAQQPAAAPGRRAAFSRCSKAGPSARLRADLVAGSTAKEAEPPPAWSDRTEPKLEASPQPIGWACDVKEPPSARGRLRAARSLRDRFCQRTLPPKPVSAACSVLADRPKLEASPQPSGWACDVKEPSAARGRLQAASDRPSPPETTNRTPAKGIRFVLIASYCLPPAPPRRNRNCTTTVQLRCNSSAPPPQRLFYFCSSARAALAASAAGPAVTFLKAAIAWSRISRAL